MPDVFLHNPRCSKSRDALALVKARSPDVRVVEYLREPPSIDELAALCRAAGIRPVELVRAKEPLFAELGLSLDDARDDAGWLKVLHRNPSLIERPIFRRGAKAVIGRPPERVLELLK